MKKLLLLLLLVPSLAWADITVHPGEYIQDALDTAQSGDVITVQDGIYKGERNRNLNFNQKALTLKSENGSENCIIDCELSGRGVFFNQEGDNDILDGFTIQNAMKGYETGGAIRLQQSSPTIRNCILKDSRARNGAGIYSVASNPVIENCKILNNEVNVTGAGLFFYNSNATIKDCVISGNHTGGNGGGIYGDRGADINISNTVISGNSAGYGGGVYGVSGCVPTLVDCEINNNSAEHAGGGFYLYYSSAIIENCFINGNSAPQVGGIYSFKGSAPVITNCVITNNTSSQYAGGATFYKPTSRPAFLTNCTICNNQGGLTLRYDTNVSVKNCIIWGNTGQQVEGEGDITYSLIGENPQFVDGYRLGAGSPCIGTGIYSAQYDIEGIERAIPPCMGAYEADRVCKTLTLNAVNGTITATPKPGLGSECLTGYSLNSIVSLTPNPAEGYRFTGWSSNVNNNEIKMDIDREVTATFEEGSMFTLTASASEGGNISVTPAPDILGRYEAGTIITITASPDADHKFDRWDGAAGGNPLTFAIMDNMTITAIFAYVAQYRLTVSVEGCCGSASPSGGLYDSGQEITLIARAWSGYELKGWSGDATGTSKYLTITMDSDKNIVATFGAIVPVQYTLTISVVGAGSVSPSGGTYNAGQEETLIARPNPGNEFVGWSGDASGSNARLPVVMDSDKTITATFREESSGGIDWEKAQEKVDDVHWLYENCPDIKAGIDRDCQN